MLGGLLSPAAAALYARLLDAGAAAEPPAIRPDAPEVEELLALGFVTRRSGAPGIEAVAPALAVEHAALVIQQRIASDQRTLNRARSEVATLQQRYDEGRGSGARGGHVEVLSEPDAATQAQRDLCMSAQEEVLVFAPRARASRGPGPPPADRAGPSRQGSFSEVVPAGVGLRVLYAAEPLGNGLGAATLNGMTAGGRPAGNGSLGSPTAAPGSQPAGGGVAARTFGASGGGLRGRFADARTGTLPAASPLAAASGRTSGAEPAGHGAAEVRVAGDLPFAMTVIDERAALLALDSCASGSLLVRAGAVVRGLRSYFDLVWERATPVGGTADPALTETQQRLLELIAGGLKDETIARHLGTSVRTLRRHVTLLEEMLGATNRVGLVVAAMRKGWLR